MAEHAFEDFEDHVRFSSRKKPRNQWTGDKGRETGDKTRRDDDKTGDKTIEVRELKHSSPQGMPNMAQVDLTSETPRMSKRPRLASISQVDTTPEKSAKFKALGRSSQVDLASEDGVTEDEVSRDDSPRPRQLIENSKDADTQAASWDELMEAEFNAWISMVYS